MSGPIGGLETPCNKKPESTGHLPVFLGISPEIYGHMHSILTAEPITDLRRPGCAASPSGLLMEFTSGQKRMRSGKDKGCPRAFLIQRLLQPILDVLREDGCVAHRAGMKCRPRYRHSDSVIARPPQVSSLRHAFGSAMNAFHPSDLPSILMC